MQETGFANVASLYLIWFLTVGFFTNKALFSIK
ncbi:hypothetical protein SHD_2831 [Shewanella decolorationis S12]|jgi:hypothetical protein|uniref:Uncharacterized protein n=1 Tax=Shewanella decolorationis S12 TaxID=1353536 RepID=A0ABP2Z2I1_9GAMM|nr:hypothetical protein SHD_2831 [Shewanella decolorationis S12]